MLNVEITDLQKFWKPDRALIKRAVKTAFLSTGSGAVLLKGRLTAGVVLVDNARIIEINRKFLRRNTVTDVIAFNLHEGCNALTDDVWGEVVVSTEKALSEAGERNIDFTQEVILYIVHGILHLLGYDDHAAEDIKKMRKKEREIVETIFSVYRSTIKRS